MYAQPAKEVFAARRTAGHVCPRTAYRGRKRGEHRTALLLLLATWLGAAVGDLPPPPSPPRPLETVEIDPSGGGDNTYKTIDEALASVAEIFPGKEVVMRLSAGEHIVSGLVLDANLTLSRLEIISSDASGGTFISSNASTLLEVRAGSPPVKLQGLELDGQVIIEGGTVEVPVEIAGCRFGALRSPGRRLAAGTTTRALLVSDGHVSISDTFFEGLLGGAIKVSGGAGLAVRTSVFGRNQAERGSALLITGGKVVVDNSRFTDNKATDATNGGAICVSGTNASLELGNKTVITGSKGHGGSVVSDVPWTFRLPAPLAHYVFNPEQDGVAQNGAGSYDYDYPIPCSATLRGSGHHNSLAPALDPPRLWLPQASLGCIGRTLLLALCESAASASAAGEPQMASR